MELIALVAFKDFYCLHALEEVEPIYDFFKNPISCYRGHLIVEFYCIYNIRLRVLVFFLVSVIAIVSVIILIVSESRLGVFFSLVILLPIVDLSLSWLNTFMHECICAKEHFYFCPFYVICTGYKNKKICMVL